MEIQAAVINEKSGPFVIEGLELEEPRANEVLVKIAGVGICHTDLVCRDQYFPVPLPCVFGHEGSGIVEACGEDVTKVSEGDHVVLSFNACGTCKACLTGKPGYCQDLYGYNFSGARPDGSCSHFRNGRAIAGNFFSQSSFASYALASERNTVKVSKEAPLELLGPLGCGIQTGAGAILNAFNPSAGSSVAVFGAGSVGLSAVMAAALCGCATIVVIDIADARLDIARSLGATHAIDPRSDNPVEAIQQITGTGVDYSLECTGIPEVFRQAVDCLTLTGTCGLLGVAPAGTACALDMQGILFGRSVRGIIEGDSIPDIFIPQLVDLYLDGKFPFDKIVSYYDFAQINEAVEDLESGRVIKAVLKP